MQGLAELQVRFVGVADQRAFGGVLDEDRQRSRRVLDQGCGFWRISSGCSEIRFGADDFSCGGNPRLWVLGQMGTNPRHDFAHG
ncbi:hypothetical protein [Nocardia camponoti]|uniref:hypothetical protein n=1 Tax=Nocardia camponoti TaxID=1616106 RepID=UPI00166399E2|nr:hypothetical protein [Nocardia camponoti]